MSSLIMGKSPALWDTVEYFNRIEFYMRTYLLLRLHFMLINTYMDLFDWIYVINYTKSKHFGPKNPFLGKSPVLWVKSPVFKS